VRTSRPCKAGSVSGGPKPCLPLHSNAGSARCMTVCSYLRVFYFDKENRVWVPCSNSAHQTMHSRCARTTACHKHATSCCAAFGTACMTDTIRHLQFKAENSTHLVAVCLSTNAARCSDVTNVLPPRFWSPPMATGPRCTPSGVAMAGAPGSTHLDHEKPEGHACSIHASTCSVQGSQCTLSVPSRCITSPCTTLTSQRCLHLFGSFAFNTSLSHLFKYAANGSG
jgi:hypothetical protein